MSLQQRTVYMQIQFHNVVLYTLVVHNVGLYCRWCTKRFVMLVIIQLKPRWCTIQCCQSSFLAAGRCRYGVQRS